jgi:two-component system, cell cycle sensor histidine kinase and response regulator CckA
MAVQQVLQQHSPQAPARRSQPIPYEGIVDLIDEAVFRTDDAGRWTFLSHAWTTVTGFPVAASIGRCLADVVHSSDAQLYADTIGPLLRGSVVNAHEHIRIVTAHGTVRWLVLRVRSERDTNGQVLGLCGTLYDITERKAEGVRREEQLRASQKMEAIGRLAGGISHDFNNLLTVILSYAQLIEEAVSDNGAVSADVTELRRASERAGELTRQLLAYSRQQLMKPTNLDLDRAVADMATMLRRVIGEDIALTLVPGPRAATVRADAGQIEQVIVNLAVNARDAMPGGGTLTIATTSAELDDSVGDLWGVRVVPGPYVVLSVTDTGQGMDKETQRRIFEPFFTTKDLGRGTGLGLATVYGIVKQSGGYIWAESAPDRGTTFRVYLPQIGPGTMDPVAAPRHVSLPRGTETILIVEDEYTVRALARRVLERAGYTVLDAGTAAQGFAVMSTYGSSVDLLLTDIIMPGATGRDLAHLVTTSDPAVKVLYMSGYDDGELAARLQGLGGALAPDVALLEKPFTPEGLARRVREVLDNTEDAAASS